MRRMSRKSRSFLGANLGNPLKMLGMAPKMPSSVAQVPAAPPPVPPAPSAAQTDIQGQAQAYQQRVAALATGGTNLTAGLVGQPQTQQKTLLGA